MLLAIGAVGSVALFEEQGESRGKHLYMIRIVGEVLLNNERITESVLHSGVSETDLRMN